jgi:hypothetical protein
MHPRRAHVPGSSGIGETRVMCFSLGDTLVGEKNTPARYCMNLVEKFDFLHVVEAKCQAEN